MIELITSIGYVKSFSIEIAEKVLTESVGLKANGQVYWMLPDDCAYAFKDGRLKEKKASKKKDVE